MIQKICVAGAGTMGSGIALTAAQFNYITILFDTNAAGIEKAKISIKENLDFLVSKQKITTQQHSDIFSRITFTTNIEECIADVIIEAIIENIEIKKTLYLTLASINKPTTILASNTSSLSITAIQKDIPNPQRVAGMHFFNPAHIMKLVEVVAGEYSTDETIENLVSLCKTMQKQAVICKDAPGFIVNRVARHYYLQTMDYVMANNANIADVDALMENAGFKMGPFKLMDLIGMDINLAVSQSLYEAFDNNPRFEPATLQKQKVAQGKLGKKTGEGFYTYPKKTVI